jgi:hypothetical protein
MVVSAAHVALARSLAEGIAPGGSGAGMWVTALSTSGNAPATHYISNGHIKPEFAALLGDAQATYQAAGGQVSLASLQAMYAAATIRSDLSPQQVQELLAGLNLQVVRL